jgi:lipopolysaccharide transport system ATP-binding protein
MTFSNYAVRVENLGKKYQIGVYQGRYKSLRDSLMQGITSPLRILKDGRLRNKNGEKTIWALKEISFDVQHGDVVGIIGRNGAGKSTLLKILARITEPTCGELRVRGRVGSLLEVGTGFHPELTGRENIFLNGAILGMSRKEIQKKFDEIVDFAEIEKFIDTPAKHYSSGMYMRLAFAVAAYLEPEILLVDEVLAVGDAAFQKKCLGKMGEVAKNGRTVLFVSHNMVAIQGLCGKCIVLDQGKIGFQGDIQGGISYYLTAITETISNEELDQRKDRQGTQELHFTRMKLFDSDENEISTILSGQSVTFRFYYDANRVNAVSDILVAFNVINPQGVTITNLNSKEMGRQEMPIFSNGYFDCIWPKVNLRSGVYTCNLFCQINGVIADWVQSAFILTIEDGDYYQTGALLDRSVGEVFVDYDWISKR